MVIFIVQKSFLQIKVAFFLLLRTVALILYIIMQTVRYLFYYVSLSFEVFLSVKYKSNRSTVYIELGNLLQEHDCYFEHCPLS
jgi:hypothetical protein